MKKNLLLCCAIIGLFGIISKPLIVNAAGHETASISYSYWFGSVTSNFEWDYIPGETITYSVGYASARGFAIYGEIYKTREAPTDHFYKTIVTRGIDIGLSYIGSVAGTYTWETDSYYTALTCNGDYLVSHDGTFE